MFFFKYLSNRMKILNSCGELRQLFAYWVIFMLFLSSADFFQNQLFQKKLSGMQSECQTVGIQITPGALSGLIWVQTVYKVYQLAKS